MSETTLGKVLKSEFATTESKEIPWVLTPDEEKITEHETFLLKCERRRFAVTQDEFSQGSSVEVPLTDQELSSALGLANKRKYLKTVHEAALANAKAIKDEQEKDLILEWTAARFLRHMRSRSLDAGKKLLETPDKLPLIKALCFRLANDPRYETELGYSFRKGLIVRGAPGIGKTYLPKLLSDNPVCNIQVITMPKIIASVMACGTFTGMNFGDHKIVYFDDIGTEHENGQGMVKYMGTPINWFKTYIEEYYANYPNHFNRLMFSTNDNFDQMEAKYGFRVRSRLSEMFNVIDVAGQDLRRA